MGALFDNLRAIVEDSKSSWYFRIWVLIWSVCAVMSFVALIVLGSTSNTAEKDKDFDVWIENTTEITFPRFHFRLSDFSEAGEEFAPAPQCSHNGAFLTNSRCATWRGENHPTTKCFAVNSDTITIKNRWEIPKELLRIYCTFSITNPNVQENSLVAFELEGENIAHLGTSSALIAPNANAHVYLSKGILSLDGRKPEDDWEKEVVYHSNVAVPGQYHVEVILRSFFVAHIEQRDSYPGWVAVGDIGGFAYFMVVLHTLCMIVVGVFFNNDSKFLSGESSTSEESRSML